MNVPDIYVPTSLIIANSELIYAGDANCAILMHSLLCWVKKSPQIRALFGCDNKFLSNISDSLKRVKAKKCAGIKNTVHGDRLTPSKKKKKALWKKIIYESRVICSNNIEHFGTGERN